MSREEKKRTTECQDIDSKKPNKGQNNTCCEASFRIPEKLIFWTVVLPQYPSFRSQEKQYESGSQQEPETKRKAERVLPGRFS